MEILNQEIFWRLNRKLICKTIEELSFEEILTVKFPSPDYELQVTSDITYRFSGSMGSWNNLQIQEESLIKRVGGREMTLFAAADFFREIQGFCEMSDETLAVFLEEHHQTLFADYQHWLKVKDKSLEEFSEMNFLSIDQLLPGHPKILLNKGRMGWGTAELEKYAPESLNAFSLYWVAAHRESLLLGMGPSIDNQALLAQSLDREDQDYLGKILSLYEVKAEDYFIFPVHPWQWNRYIRIQYQEMIFLRKLILLGDFGHPYSPQVSLRTLSNTRFPKNLDIKLSVSILNTSCVRGIPPKFIRTGHHLSHLMADLVKNDPFLVSKNVNVLQERAAVSCPLNSHLPVKNAPYRFHELLGCVWRESVQSKVSEEQKAVPTAALFYKLDQGYLAQSYIEKSQLTPQEWVRRYFEHVVLPLYHLQLKYGVGLVAHGQNTILILDKNAPAGLIIKDFHGDLRFSRDSVFKDVPEIFQVVDILPPEHLIHDLITGHFITVLRYLSRALQEGSDLPESDFYQVMAQVIEQYLKDFGWQGKIPEPLNLLRPFFEKILVNKVRFVSGYSESPARLKPLLGNPLKNPLFR